jgi:hypothetical protein
MNIEVGSMVKISEIVYIVISCFLTGEVSLMDLKTFTYGARYCNIEEMIRRNPDLVEEG